MGMTKYASYEVSEVLDLKGSHDRVHSASLEKLADFEDYRTEDGYLYARIRAISSRVNKNHDGWPSVELAGSQSIFDRHQSSEGGFTIEANKDNEYGFSTFLGKPMFVDHHNSNPGRARGAIVDTKFHVDDHRTAASLDPYYASAPDNHLPPSWVELLIEVDAKSFPKLAKAIIEGSKNSKKGIDGFSMGCDVERSVCNICKNSATSPEEFCNHVKMKGAHFDYIDPKTGRKTSKRSYEDCYGIKFFEISAVFDPADETALTREIRSSVEKEADLVDPNSIDQLKRYPDELRRNSPWYDPSKVFDVGCPHCNGQGVDANGSPCPMCKGEGGWDPPRAGGDGAYAPSEAQPSRIPNYGEELPLEMRLMRKRQGGWDDQSSGLMPHDLLEGKPLEKHQPYRTYPDTWNKDPQEQEAAIYRVLQGLSSFAESSPSFNVESAAEHGLQQLIQVGIPPEIADEVIGSWKVKMTQHMDQGASDLALPGKTPESLGEFSGTPQEYLAGLAHYAMHRIAENAEPQADLVHAPVSIDTLREEKICPVCGSNMDEETCSVCGYIEPPDGFDNPDLEKAKKQNDQQDQAEGAPSGGDLGNSYGDSPTTTPTLSSLPAHVTNEMSWELTHPKVAGQINSVERPVLSNGSKTNEPKETVIKDQTKPVTSSVRTASDFIAAAGATNRRTMDHTAEAASGAPAVAKPDTNTEVTGVGGVQDASNEQASKADAQVDVEAIGGTGVESVKADKENVNVEQGNEHSKNIEGIHTDTWHTKERQHDPVSSEPFPASADGVKASAWVISDVHGVDPADPLFKADERIDVTNGDAHSITTENSGPTTTWSGTDGNGVLRQQDPVTDTASDANQNSNSWSEDPGTKDYAFGDRNSHIFAAFKLADLEIEMGLLDEARKYERVAELENEEAGAVEASLKYARRVRTAKSSSKKTAGRVPPLGRVAAVDHTSSEKQSISGKESVEDSVLFM